MASSREFRLLEKRLSQLRDTLLPRLFDPTGKYTAVEIDSALGYRLLAHAEIEIYLEEISKNIVLKSVKYWVRNRKPTPTLIATLASYHSGWKFNDDSNHNEIIEIAKTRSEKNSLKNIIDNAATQYVNKVKGNHGVKEENLKVLLLPTGIDWDGLDPTWVLDMTNFGELRGKSAHTSSYKYTVSEINPKDEYDRVNGLLVGLKILDHKLQELNKKIR